MSSRLKVRAHAEAMDPPSLSAHEASLSPQLPYRLPFQHIAGGVVCLDALLIATISVLTGIGYHRVILDSSETGFGVFVAVGILVFANFAALTAALQNYRPTSLINFGRQLRFITGVWWFIFTFLTGIAFTLKIAETFSRGATLLFFLTGWASLVGVRYVIAQGLKRALDRGTFAEKRIVLISDVALKSSFESVINLRRCGYLPVKTCDLTHAEIESSRISKSLLEKVDDIIAFCQRDKIEMIVLHLKWGHQHFIEELVRLLRILAIPVHLLPDDNVGRLLKSRSVNVGTTWTLELQRAPLSSSERAIKRTFDVVGATLALILLSPLLAIVALLIKMDSKGPVLFKQKRNGFNGRTFTIYKFRSMHVLEDGKVIVQAKRNDPRLTRLGGWLRHTSIDELPQLLNVIAGDMSLVGPRPHAIAHNDEYQKILANYAFRHHVKPGITGWAQVSGYRGETKTIDMMEHRVEHDLWYINHWSIWLDLRILLKTMVLAYRQPTAY